MLGAEPADCCAADTAAGGDSAGTAELPVLDSEAPPACLTVLVPPAVPGRS